MMSVLAVVLLLGVSVAQFPDNAWKPNDDFSLNLDRFDNNAAEVRGSRRLGSSNWHGLGSLGLGRKDYSKVGAGLGYDSGKWSGSFLQERQNFGKFVNDRSTARVGRNFGRGWNAGLEGVRNSLGPDFLGIGLRKNFGRR